MKLKNVAIAATALALAVGMTACGSSSSTAASSSVASSAAASSEAASSEAASSEAAEPTTAEYTVYNTTGSKVTDLYLYEVGAEDKGDNLAGDGLADGDSVVITRDVEADKQADVTYVLEFTTAGGSHRLQYPKPSRSKDFAEGSVVTLYYDPEAPEKMYVEGDKSVLGAEALYAGIGVALLVLMFALL